jgi:hypothetical protein
MFACCSAGQRPLGWTAGRDGRTTRPGALYHFGPRVEIREGQKRKGRPGWPRAPSHAASGGGYWQLPPVHTPLTHPVAPFAGQGLPLVVKQVWMVTGLQICVVGSGQSAVTLQWTQRLLSASPDVSQTGLGATHCERLVAEHCSQVWAVVQAGFPATVHCASATHATQEAAVPSTPSQTPPVHGVPDVATVHVPVEQLLHTPVHVALLQQKPPTQLPLEHWVPSPPAHIAPFAWAGTHWCIALQ